MKTFIGTKILSAGPMTLGAYNIVRGWDIPADEDPARAGYLVVYPDGYRSWSPAEVFEASYREISADEFRILTPHMQADPVKPDTFFSRLVAERDETGERLDKLDGFILTPAFAAIDQDNRTLLQRQALQMRGYVDTLDARIKLLGQPADPRTAPENFEDPDNGVIETRTTGGGSVETPVPFNG